MDEKAKGGAMIRPAFVAALCLLSAPAAAETVHVIDGDGLRFNGQTVRLWGIDAPELRQTCSRAGNAILVENMRGTLSKPL